MESLCNNQKEPSTFFYVIKAVDFFNERPYFAVRSNIHTGQDCRSA